ncbi:hypothetical protein N431DRAFT_545599 [Stipitochalara longipes BDJ]|nr:hypothetical protein N431DRAFT_545599 [Stipitochalara longipes BDJ]
MQFSSLFLAVLFTSAVIADGSAAQDKKHHHHDHRHHKEGRLERECDKIFSLEKLENLVANSTALAEVTHGNATKIAELQAKASQDASKLTDLKNNQTLIVECQILAAAEKLERDCLELLKLEEFLKFASNATEVSTKANNNGTRITEIAAEASQGSTKLQQLQSNSTLVAICFIVDAHNKEKHQCEEIKGLEKFIAFANNSTALVDDTKNNVTKINEIKAESSKAADRLANLQSNATLVADCASFGHPTSVEAQADTQGADTAANATSPATTTQTSTPNEAGGKLLAKLGVISSIAVLASGMLML